MELKSSASERAVKEAIERLYGAQDDSAISQMMSDLTQEMNVSTFCLGARLIAEFEADRMGIGMPYSMFADVVQGMEDSAGGFPFANYPGATSAAAS